MDHVSTVYLREYKQKKEVRITSSAKPKIESKVIEKWQFLLNTLAKMVNVPSALIMQLQKESIQVFLKSEGEDNPYEVGEEAPLIYGLYCETVIGTQHPLLIPDARKIPIWAENNPDVDINMISYLGFPINWPDGEVFGTVCILDKKENHYSDLMIDFLNQMKLHIESDLKILNYNVELEEKNKMLEALNATKTKFLSLISHDVRGKVGVLDQFLQLILTNYNSIDKQNLKSIIESLSNSASSAYQLLIELLSWSKNDLMQLEPELKQVDLKELVKELIVFFKDVLNAKKLHTIQEYNTSQLICLIDPNILKTALRNIVSNAIKASDEGGMIKIRILSNEKNLIIEVEDTGKGMSQETIQNLFSSNLKGSSYSESVNASAGVGLILSKDLLTKINSTIEVESTLGIGSLFRIKIPVLSQE